MGIMMVTEFRIQIHGQRLTRRFGVLGTSIYDHVGHNQGVLVGKVNLIFRELMRNHKHLELDVLCKDCTASHLAALRPLEDPYTQDETPPDMSHNRVTCLLGDRCGSDHHTECCLFDKRRTKLDN